VVHETFSGVVDGHGDRLVQVACSGVLFVQRCCVQPWSVLGVVAASDVTLLPLVLRQQRRLVVLLLLHLRFWDEEGAAGVPLLLLPRLGLTGGVANFGSSFTSRLGTV
jgi:hypothetical protein